MKRDLLAGLDRFIERSDQLEALAALQSIDQGRVLISQAIDHVLVIGLMTEAVDVRRIDREFLDHLLVRRRLLDEAPVPDLVHGKARDLDRAFLAEDRKRPFEVGWSRGGGRLDDAERAVAEFQCRNRSIL